MTSAVDRGRKAVTQQQLIGPCPHRRFVPAKTSAISDQSLLFCTELVDNDLDPLSADSERLRSNWADAQAYLSSSGSKPKLFALSHSGT